RGAPAIGIAAAFGLALEAKQIKTRDPSLFLLKMSAAGRMLCATRPTAVNLAWAVRRVLAVVEDAAGRPAGVGFPGEAASLVLAEASAILEEDLVANRAIGRHGSKLVPKGARILTHCNAGALAMGGYGTALGVIRAAHDAGRKVSVLVDETRPYLQGARLTAWELKQYGIPHHLITDNMAGHFISRGEVDLIVTGADRIASNGDTANKIGTYTLAVLAKENGIPFYIAAPRSTFDLSIKSGAEIPIEERDPVEVTSFRGRPVAPRGTPARHPAFDVTPARLITAIITEHGVITRPYSKGIRAAFACAP
ncbi:MAG: S-methyl-5-thioribose-1-phosphate isomerase, partial [Myxococcota bacterium]